METNDDFLFKEVKYTWFEVNTGTKTKTINKDSLKFLKRIVELHSK